MGDPKKFTNTYSRPRKMWDKVRINEETKIQRGYGLKNKKEVWRAKAYLANVRQNARSLLGKSESVQGTRGTEIVNSLKSKGVLEPTAKIEDVLALQIEDVLERRLQTQVWKKGLAGTPKQARQFIVHGHIQIGENLVTSPGYLLKAGEENKLKFIGSEYMLPKPKEAKPTKNERVEKLKSLEDEKPEGSDEKKEEPVKETESSQEKTKKEE